MRIYILYGKSQTVMKNFWSVSSIYSVDHLKDTDYIFLLFDYENRESFIRNYQTTRIDLENYLNFFKESNYRNSILIIGNKLDSAKKNVIYILICEGIIYGSEKILCKEEYILNSH